MECKLDKKLTKNNAKIGIGSQCVTTFLGKEDINYLVTAFKHNDDTSDLHFSQTTGANKILKNFVLPGLIIRAEVVQKNLTLYTATTKKQFHNVCGIVPGTQGSEVKWKLPSRKTVSGEDGGNFWMQVELQDTINSILYDPKDYEENIGTEFGSGISEVRVGNQRCKRFMKFTFNHDHQSIQYSLKHVPVIASSDYAAVDDCFQ